MYWHSDIMLIIRRWFKYFPQVYKPAKFAEIHLKCKYTGQGHKHGYTTVSVLASDWMRAVFIRAALGCFTVFFFVTPPH